MKLGIVSDTHSGDEIFKRVLEYFRRVNVDLIIHCGDWASSDMVELCKGFSVMSVFGNCDYGHKDLKVAGESAGVEFHVPFLDVEFDGVRIAATHGDDHLLLRKLIGRNKYDFVFSGHTHRSVIDKIGKTVHLCPGSPSKPRDGVFSVALVDLKTKKSEIVDLKTVLY